MSFLDRIKGPKGSSRTAGAAAEVADASGALAMSALPQADQRLKTAALSPMAPSEFNELMPPSAMEATIRLEPGVNAAARVAQVHAAPLPYLAPPPGPHPTPGGGAAVAPPISIIAEAAPSELATEFNESTTSPKATAPFEAA